MTKETYLNNPCGASSIPLWKAKTVSVPGNMKIVHENDFSESDLAGFQDEPYFRLMHDLQDVTEAGLPAHFSFCSASAAAYADHISSCYADLRISREELQSYTTRPVYAPELWLAVKDDRTGEIVATGIGELDREIGEGVLEWIQVSGPYRGRGIGKSVVLELLRRMKGAARFATVSGRCRNPSDPEALYRACGFTGNDVWHILTKK